MFNAFTAERLGPVMAQLGINAQPEITIHDAHEVCLPQAATVV